MNNTQLLKELSELKYSDSSYEFKNKIFKFGYQYAIDKIMELIIKDELKTSINNVTNVRDKNKVI